MTPKERMRLAMSGQTPDRVPVMCQLAEGHIYRHCGLGPLEYWYTLEGRAQGLMQLTERYQFDGILVSTSQIDPHLRQTIDSVERVEGGHRVSFTDGRQFFLPVDDGPRLLPSAARPPVSRTLDQIDPDAFPALRLPPVFPPHSCNLIKYILERKGAQLSIHGEVGTALGTFLMLFGFPSFEPGLMALMDDPQRSLQLLKHINQAKIAEALHICSTGVDALKLSSPFASASFISREMYELFVLPFEKELIDRVKECYSTPIYTHTCGKIGDRLDLMVRTGLDGIECLDPIPLGDVDLQEAVEQIGHQAFIKGNLDSVHELDGHTPSEVLEICRQRIEIGKKVSRGFILSSACSVSPKAPRENISVLHTAAERYGRLQP